jgi:hypothetical protein
MGFPLQIMQWSLLRPLTGSLAMEHCYHTSGAPLTGDDRADARHTHQPLATVSNAAGERTSTAQQCLPIQNPTAAEGAPPAAMPGVKRKLLSQMDGPMLGAEVAGVVASTIDRARRRRLEARAAGNADALFVVFDPSRLPEAHSRPSPVLLDELDAGDFHGMADGHVVRDGH